MTDAEQVSRWLDELKAGRARAGTLVGSHLAYLALTPSDCNAARDALMRADELGSDRAARSLADLATNTSCGEVDEAAVERWLKKAVTLDHLAAAQRLIALYAPDGRRPDPVAAIRVRARGRGLLGKRLSQRAKPDGHVGVRRGRVAGHRKGAARRPT